MAGLLFPLKGELVHPVIESLGIYNALVKLLCAEYQEGVKQKHNLDQLLCSDWSHFKIQACNDSC